MTRTHELTTEQLIPRPRAEVFAFFADAQNLERITPPALRFEITSPLPVRIGPGTTIRYRLHLFGIPFRWESVITRWEPGRLFVDEQREGPYALWVHTHAFRDAEDGTVVADTVRYRLPFFPIGEVAYPLVRRQLDRIFEYRRRRLRERFPSRGPAG